MDKKTKLNRAKHVSTGTGDIVKQKVASVSILKKGVNTSSVSKYTVDPSFSTSTSTSTLTPFRDETNRKSKNKIHTPTDMVPRHFV